MSRSDITDKQVCQAFSEWMKNRNEFATAILHRMTGEPMKVCHSACERAVMRGFIDCGVSVRSGWLTEKGKELIQ